VLVSGDETAASRRVQESPRGLLPQATAGAGIALRVSLVNFTAEDEVELLFRFRGPRPSWVEVVGYAGVEPSAPRKDGAWDLRLCLPADSPCHRLAFRLADAGRDVELEGVERAEAAP
jgi:hypothetical protein